jgi:DNA-binding transcriptional ArsR family regulator
MTEQEAVLFGKAIADKTRQSILKFCCCQRRSVGEIAKHAKVTQPTASHHLALLKEARLVKAQREGKEVYYAVDQRRIVSCCGNLLFTLAPEEEATKTMRRCNCC